MATSQRFASGRKKCVHESNPRLCVQCKLLGTGGQGICKCGNNKHYCYPCGSTIMCKHHRRKKRCPECNPSVAVVAVATKVREEGVPDLVIDKWFIENYSATRVLLRRQHQNIVLTAEIIDIDLNKLPHKSLEDYLIDEMISGR